MALPLAATRKRLPFFLTLAGAASALQPVHAELGDIYAGANVLSSEYENSNFSSAASLRSVYGRLGLEISDFLSSELRYGVGLDEDTVFEGVDAKVRNFFGGYVRAGLPNESILFPYLVAGYTAAEIKASGGGFRSYFDESDVSYGAGIDIELSRYWQINLEYMNYLDSDDGEVSGFSIGVATTF